MVLSPAAAATPYAAAVCERGTIQFGAPGGNGPVASV